MASNIQRIEEKKRLRTTSPTGWVPKKPVEEDPWLVKLLSLDCKDGNAGVCIVSTSIGKDESRTRGFCTAIPQRRYFCDSFGSQWRFFSLRLPGGWPFCEDHN